MDTLSYTVTMSLDGYAADAAGGFDWSAPGDDVFRFHIDRMDAVSTEVLGRRTHLLMRYWEAAPSDATWTPAEEEFSQRWCRLTRVVASSTLTEEECGPGSVRLARDLDLEQLAAIVRDAPGEVEIFGPTTAAPALRAGMVSDIRVIIVPRAVGGGLRALPDRTELDLRCVEHRIFDGGAVLLHYAPR